jgi:hypothetical protein
MLRLSPRQIQALAGLILGGGDDSPVQYRTRTEIESLVQLANTGIEFSGYGLSRFDYASRFIDLAQTGSSEGASGLSRATEQILEALLDVREFASEDLRDEALLRINQSVLNGIPAEARIADDGSVEIVSTRQTRSQRVLDEQIHTAFGGTVSESALIASRTHYAKARRHLTAANPDYENAAKEAVTSLESLVLTLTGETDFIRAIRKMTDAGLIPRPLDDIAVKLYAYRGNEPGVAHGSPDAPDVTEDEALLIFNLCAALGAYHAKALRAD